MAEFDRTPPADADEADYRQALLDDDAGRERRRARLMAALPRPDGHVAVPVSDGSLAWRRLPRARIALAALLMALLLAAAWVMKARQADPRPGVDLRIAAVPAASAPVVVARAGPVIEPAAPASAEAPRVAAKTRPARPQPSQPAPVVMADATLPRPPHDAEAGTAAAAESTRAEMATPPPAAPAVAAAPAPRAAADASDVGPGLARSKAVSNGVAARLRGVPPLAQSLAASDAPEPSQAVVQADALLLAAAGRGDLGAARLAVQAGASVHLRDAQARTPLMLAARSGSRDLVELLLAAGAPRADRDAQGWTAADHARDRGHDELVDTLR